MLKLTSIISGGQTGADRGGLDAAIQLGIAFGGACPEGRRAEDGPIPAKYDTLTALPGSSYEPRTRKNVRDADATIIFNLGNPSRGLAPHP
jgi:predicted Rossmann-fold nucleotide-binding protein